MNLKQLFKEDDAVSPVIGVILMVAITVILAAVIASFVLGLGDSTGDVQPTTNFEFDYNGTALEIKSTSGDTVDPNNLYIRGSNVTNFAASPGSGSTTSPDSPPADKSVADLASGSSGAEQAVTALGDLSDDEMNSGEGIIITFASDTDQFEIDLIWETSEDSATLASESGPDA